MKLSRLYNKDETAWLEESARLVQQPDLNGLDYKNLREHLTSMAESDRRQTRSRLRVLLVHLLKWQFQPEGRSKSWKNTINSQRDDLGEHLRKRTLRNHAKEILEEVYHVAREFAADETDLDLSRFPETCPYSLDQLLGDFLPE